MSSKPLAAVRTRFAPSPTGYLHVGGARTALYSWLYAKHRGGQFILRIEDTDRERSTQEAIDAIVEGMTWLGLDHDEGPFYQTERMARYYEVIQKMLDEGTAYKCYCSKERLDKVRTDQQEKGGKPRYDGHCRDAAPESPDAPFVVRFKNPKEGEVTFTDLIRGPITVANAELDDLIIARTDGTPTYNFTVVVDDWDMQITDVIRGDDHINNTPRQINMLKALGMEPPRYAHVPMILGEDGKRLSKRHGAVSVMQYQQDGYLPEALLNYLVRLGWSHGDQEIFSLAEMQEYFDFEHVSHSPAAFNTEKLQWLNQHYMKSMPAEAVAIQFDAILRQMEVPTDNGPALTDVVAVQAERCKTLVEMADKSRFFYIDFETYDEKAANKNLKPAILPALQAAHKAFEALPHWEKEPLHQVIIDTAEAFELKLGKMAQPLRVACTGGTVSPPLDETLYLIGRERVLERIARAIHFIQA